jgi:CBS domain containing-hemolysin-like protein
VGGLVIGVAGRIPDVGEVFTFDGLTLTVRNAAPQRVESVEAALLDQPSPS